MCRGSGAAGRRAAGAAGRESPGLGRGKLASVGVKRAAPRRVWHALEAVDVELSDKGAQVVVFEIERQHVLRARIGRLSARLSPTLALPRAPSSGPGPDGGVRVRAGERERAAAGDGRVGGRVVRACANFVLSTMRKVSPCSLQQTRSSEAGDDTISNSLIRNGATLSSSSETAESEASSDIVGTWRRTVGRFRRSDRVQRRVRGPRRGRCSSLSLRENVRAGPSMGCDEAFLTSLLVSTTSANLRFRVPHPDLILVVSGPHGRRVSEQASATSAQRRVWGLLRWCGAWGRGPLLGRTTERPVGCCWPAAARRCERGNCVPRVRLRYWCQLL